MRRLINRPSPGTVIGSLALLVALGGTSMAAVSIVVPNNSVGPAQLKSDAVTSLKVANGTLLKADFKAGQIPAGPAGPAGSPGTAGPAGPAGPTGASGAAGVKWALVASNGVIVKQAGGVTLAAKPGIGQYILDFGGSVADKLIVVSSAHAAGDTTYRGSVNAGPCGSPDQGSGCPQFNDTSHVRVFTTAPGDQSTQDHPFYIAVLG